MYVLVVGGGRTGSQLARFLINQNHEVHVVESRREVLSQIHREIPTECIHEGNYIDVEVLERAGIRQAGVVAAVTRNDEHNLLICYIARTVFNVNRTIARVNNPRNAWLFNNLFKVDVSLNATDILAHLIEEEMSMGDMMTLTKIRRGNFSLVEEKIPPGAISIGVPIKDLGLPDQCVIAAIIRKGQVIVPRGMASFEAGDEVLAITDHGGAERLAELLSPPKPSRPNGNGNGKSKTTL